MSTPPSNLVTRAVAAGAPLYSASNWNALSRLYAEDLIRIDRRPLGAATTYSRSEWLIAAQAVTVQFDTQSDPLPLETRGECLALIRIELTTAAGYLLEIFQVMQSDSDGIITKMVFFADEALAVQELNRAWAEEQSTR